tara:strand:- start:686 stop:895 length:210 start_codon:yes stop_codon:yes gene_type:complete
VNEEKLIDECVERIVEIGVPIETLPTLLEQLLEGSALIIDTDQLKIHCFKKGAMFEEERALPAKGYEPR